MKMVAQLRRSLPTVTQKFTLLFRIRRSVICATERAQLLSSLRWNEATDLSLNILLIAEGKRAESIH